MSILKKGGAKPAAKKAAPAKPAAKKHTPTATELLRHEIVKWAHWFYEHGATMPYTEGPERSGCLHHPIGTEPSLLDTDCSGFVTLLYAWSGVHDPNGLNTGTFKHAGDWHELGYTGTLLEHAYQHGHVFTDLSEALPGDLIVYGPTTGLHVEVVVAKGANPKTIGHGYKGIHHSSPSQDGREPVRVVRAFKGGR